MNEILIKKYDMDLYNSGSFMYNEYPHKSVWSKEFNEIDFRGALKSCSLNQKSSYPRMLYLHIPFCSRRCLFCICHTLITKDYAKIKNYLSLLFCEIDLLRKFLTENSIPYGFQEIHIGGGSPTILQEKEFNRLIEKIRPLIDVRKISTFSIEIDPRVVDKERLKYYHTKGVNRISFGIQDFDPDVQNAINRVQSPELIARLISPDVRKYFKGINFDILCGLPRQTRASFRKTINTVIELSPDRIMLMFLTYSPEVKKHQNLMRKSDFPTISERMIFFQDAIRILLDNGYARIGVDHFAKPSDDLAVAMKNKTMHWNSLGYGPGAYLDMFGLGLGSSSTITPRYYSQNVYSLPDYEAAVRNGQFPIYRGYRLDDDDLIRRDIIHTMRSYLTLNCYGIEKKYNIEFAEYFKKEMFTLNYFVNDGLLKISDKRFTITETGKGFVSAICRVFDKYRGIKIKDR